MLEKEYPIDEGELTEVFFDEAYHAIPFYNERFLLSSYERVCARLSRSAGIGEIENLPKMPNLKESGRAFLDDLEGSCVKSQDLKDQQVLKDFLCDYQIPTEKIKNGELGQEFLVFATVLKNIVKPVLDSPTYGKDFKINQNAYVGLVRGLSREFRYGDRTYFMFHAGEALQIRRIYVAGKTIGIINAIALFGRQIVNRW